MLSDAGKRMQRQSQRTLNTAQRSRMYYSIEVEHAKKPSPNKKSLLQTIGRDIQDSFFLRYNKQTVVNTNYYPNNQLLHPQAKRQIFDKAPFTRIIGDVRNQDCSLPLIEGCDRRCEDSFITLPQQNTHKTRAQHHHLMFSKQLSRSRLSQSLELKKMASISSTKQSEHPDTIQPISRRSQLEGSAQKDKSLERIRRFDHDIGHQYGQLLFKDKKLPCFYDIQNSNEQIVKKSMSSPRGHVRFASFRDRIVSRYDRVGPHWCMILNYDEAHENPEWKSARALNFDKQMPRSPNEIPNKYHIRENMELRSPRNLSLINN